MLLLKNSKGISLVEILATMTILSIILISFSTLITQGYIFTSKNEGSLVSSNLANHVLETVQKKYLPTSCIVADNNNNLLDKPDYSNLFPNNKFTLNGTTFSIIVNLICGTDSTKLDILHVKIYDDNGTKISAQSFGYVSKREN